MATREEKQVRLELPSTSGVECEIRESLSHDEYILTFYQNERLLKSCSITPAKLDQDNIVDLVSDAGVEFFSFSAIFDVADLLIKSIKEEFQKPVVGEEKLVTTESKGIDEVQDTIDTIEEKEAKTDTLEPVGSERKVTIESGDKILHRFEMSYSKEGYAAVYYCRDGKYAVVLYQNNTPVIRKKYSKDNVSDDDLVAMISDSGIDFLSFSAIYDSAETIQKIILNPEEYLESEKGEDTTLIESEATISSQETTSTIAEDVIEDEMVMVDLSALDVSEYTKAEDFDRFVVKVTEFVNEGQPLPIKEVDIERSGGVVCIILRQMDSWFIRFRRKDGSLSEITNIKIDQDEIAKLINQDIPQISFSYLYDASENIFKVMEHLAKQPMGDVILNVAVGHFLQVIENYETEGDLKSAAQVTEVLLKRFRREKNIKGIFQFGKKLLDYYESQKKITKAIKLRNTLADELLEIDPKATLEFVSDSLDVLVDQKKFLNAANLCGSLLDYYLTIEENVENLQNVMTLGRKQIDFYKSARLPSVMEENALRYAHYVIQQMNRVEEGQITTEQIENFQETILYLLDQAFDSQEERNAHFELLESLESTLKILLEVNDKTNYIKYVDRLLLSLETQDKKEKALETTIASTKLLLDPDNYVKACDYGNKAIKLFYEINKVPEAVDFSLDVVKGLVEIKETNAARDYLKFVESLVEKAYKNDDKNRIEKHLMIGDLFGKLGLKDQAKSYIHNALETITDSKKREKIVLDYVDDLLMNQATLSAQEMVNHELSRLLNAKKTEEVVKFCISFIVKLREYKQPEMVFEYMKYCSSLMIQSGITDYKVLLDFIKALEKTNEIDRAAFILNQLIILQKNQKEYTRAIDSTNRFIEYLLENTERFDLVEYYIQRIAEAYREMGDPEGAVDGLIAFQKRLLEHSVELAQRITDMILKELEQKEDYKNCISIVSPMIEKQLELGKYQDAYIFSVQNARYYERLGDIGKVIKYLEEIRDKFIHYEQYEEANRMADLILRFGRSHKKNKLAIESMRKYSKDSLDRGDTKTASRFALEMAKLLEEENKGDKALDFLQMIFNTTYNEDKESALQVFQYILILRVNRDEFKKIAQKYLEPLLQDYPDIKLVEAIKDVIKPPFEEYLPFTEKIFDNIVSSDEISEDVAEAIVNFVISAYDEGWAEEGDRIANKYASRLIQLEQITSSSRLMATVLERTEKPVAEVLPDSFKFIKELITNSLLEGAREYSDRVIRMVTSEKKFGSEGRLLGAKIAEKFAVYVAQENPDLASEYAYQASTYYRSLNDFDGVVTVYHKLAEKVEDSRRTIRTYKRGIGICNKYKAHKHEAKLLSHLTEFLIISHNVAAIASFQQTLEKLEELQDLDELFNTTYLLIETAIVRDNLKIAYAYLDYISRLSTMINKKEDIGGVIVFLLRHSEEVQDKKHIGLVKKYLDELDIKPKKFNKAYTNLAKRRISHLETKLEKPEPKELEPEPEPVPVLVKTDEIVPQETEVSVAEPPQELIEETIDEEIVNVIKGLGKEIPEKPEVDEILPKSIPSTMDEPTLANVSQPSTVETQIDTDVSAVTEEVPIEKPEAPERTALTDEEITALFYKSPSSRQEALLKSIPEPESQEIPPNQEISTERVPESEDVTILDEEAPGEIRTVLSEKEMESLFLPKETTPKVEVEAPETEKSVEDEWEVDSFGRLWKKGTIPDSTDDTTKPVVKKEEYPSDLSTATPDLTPLEKMIKLRKEMKSSAEPTTNIFEESSTTETTEDIYEETLLQDDEPVTPEIFDMPQVEYREITPAEESTESKIETPDLADLFSDALSELGSISGKSGEAAKDKKK